jgi:uncharacterized protein YlxW (UPF0749 family)
MAETTHSVAKKNKPFRGLLGYSWILKNIVFFLFLALLAVFYIANGHMADRTIRKINDTGKELKELQYEYKTLKSEVMFMSKESEMVRTAAPLGLKIDSVPPVRITYESTKR